MKYYKFFLYAYLFFAVLFTYEAISNWSVDRNKSYVMMLLAALAVFMFLFKRRFGKKFENNDKS